MKTYSEITEGLLDMDFDDPENVDLTSDEGGLAIEWLREHLVDEDSYMSKRTNDLRNTAAVNAKGEIYFPGYGWTYFVLNFDDTPPSYLKFESNKENMWVFKFASNVTLSNLQWLPTLCKSITLCAKNYPAFPKGFKCTELTIEANTAGSPAPLAMDLSDCDIKKLHFTKFGGQYWVEHTNIIFPKKQLNYLTLPVAILKAFWGLKNEGKPVPVTAKKVKID